MCTLSWIPGLDGHVLMVNRDERRTRVDGERGRAGRHPCGRAEEVDLETGRGEIAVAEQRERAAGPQPVGEDLERRPISPGQRDDLHAQ